MLRLALAALLAETLLGCDDLTLCSHTACALCGPALTVTVRDSVTGRLIEGAKVSLAGNCPSGTCTVQEMSVGTHRFVVSAPGHAPLELEDTWYADPAKCCNCGTTPVVREVRLTPM